MYAGRRKWGVIMLRLFKYLNGYLTIKVWGYSPERFMNLCSNHNILIWDVRHYEEYYVMNISLKGFLRLRPIVRKTKTRVAILQRYGLPFFVPKIRRRFVFAVGILGCMLFLMLMTTYIWSIEVDGNTNITDEEFMDYLTAQGITYGMKKKDVPIEELEKDIRLQFNIVTWDSVKLKGTRLYIQLRENTLIENEKKKEQKYQASDLISPKDGVIVEMITRSGIPKVTVGTTVKKGDLLVSGLIPIVGEDTLVKKYQYSNADADIYLQCVYNYKDCLKLEYEERCFTGSKKQIHFIEIMGRGIDLPHRRIRYKEYDIYTETHQLKILDNYYLPVYWGTKEVREYECVTKKYSKEEAKQKLIYNLNEFIATLKEKGVQIIEKDVKIVNISETMKATGSIQVIEPTGVQVASTIPEENNKEMEKADE